MVSSQLDMPRKPILFAWGSNSLPSWGSNLPLASREPWSQTGRFWPSSWPLHTQLTTTECAEGPGLIKPTESCHLQKAEMEFWGFQTKHSPLRLEILTQLSLWLYKEQMACSNTPHTPAASHTRISLGDMAISLLQVHKAQIDSVFTSFLSHIGSS